MKTSNVPYVLAVMATAGLYDDSGKWLYHTGLPAKSGVGGGIIAVAPGKFGIAVISPPLDDAGNSVRAQRTIQDIVARLKRQPVRRRRGGVEQIALRRWEAVRYTASAPLPNVMRCPECDVWCRHSRPSTSHHGANSCRSRFLRPHAGPGPSPSLGRCWPSRRSCSPSRHSA
jgi:hypothetical protein